MTYELSITKPYITNSVVRNQSRVNRWGSNRYRSNCNGAIFADLVLR